MYIICVYTYDPYDTISKKLGLIIINFISIPRYHGIIMMSSLRSYFKVWAVAGKNEGNRVIMMLHTDDFDRSFPIIVLRRSVKIPHPL